MASENPIRYAGYGYDETTGFYYLMARYYDAETGRVIVRDTFKAGITDKSLSLEAII